MKPKNAMQLKARIKARAKYAGVSPQLLLQDYMLERLLERISLSSWRDQIVVKGGMLIASLLGVDNRVTKDLDTTVQGFSLTHESAAAVFRDIIATEIDDDITFEFVRTEDIREDDIYPGIRVFLKAHYSPMVVSLSVDVTTGDVITPGVVKYDYQLFFDDYSIALAAYPLETVLAEKLETVIRRGRATTRPRDYYDIWALWETRGNELSLADLGDALVATSAKRKSVDAIENYRQNMNSVAKDEVMLKRWDSFAKEYSYVGTLSLPCACETVCKILEAARLSEKVGKAIHES